MKKTGKRLLLLTLFCILSGLNCSWSDESAGPKAGDRAPFGPAKPVGRIAEARLGPAGAFEQKVTVLRSVLVAEP